VVVKAGQKLFYGRSRSVPVAVVAALCCCTAFRLCWSDDRSVKVQGRYLARSHDLVMVVVAVGLDKSLCAAVAVTSAVTDSMCSGVADSTARRAGRRKPDINPRCQAGWRPVFGPEPPTTRGPASPGRTSVRLWWASEVGTLLAGRGPSTRRRPGSIEACAPGGRPAPEYQAFMVEVASWTKLPHSGYTTKTTRVA
jgi:hypothetical protein